MKYSSTSKNKTAGVHRVRDNKLITQIQAGEERIGDTFISRTVTNKTTATVKLPPSLN